MRQRRVRESSAYREESRVKQPTSLSAPVLRSCVHNLPPLQSPHWRAPGGQREPQGHPVNVCSDDLQEAALRGDLGLVRRLIQAGASVNSPIRALGDDEYMTLPHMLASKPEIPNGTRILAEIVESTANPNVRSSMGSTPLMFACLNKNVGAVEVLLGCGARLDPVDDHQRTALRCSMILFPEKPASERISAEITRLLADASVDLDEGGSLPPITEAVLQNNNECIRALLELGATADGLHEAVTNRSLDMIRKLVEKEANPFARDAQGKTVMEAALARGDDEITTLLRDYVGNLERSQHPHLTMRRLDEEDMHDGQKKFFFSRKNRSGEDMGADQAGIRGWAAKKRDRLQQYLRQTYTGIRFQIFMFAVLLLALFLPDLWVISSATNTEALDWILVGIFATFILEFTMQLVGEWSTYFLSFAFWMDIVGVLSVPLDHSLVTNLLFNSIDLEGATLARATKIVKLGVRSVRFSRLVKLIRFLPDSGQSTVGSTAKKMAGILGKKVSIQVSCLIISTIIVLPTIDFFLFPLDDHSMMVWTTLIARAQWNSAADLAPLMVEFEQFYKDFSYFPYEVHFVTGNGTGVSLQLSGKVPERKEDRMRVEKTDTDRNRSVAALFNFREPNRTESICNCLLILAIIVIMFTSASLVTHSVSKIVLLPLERLLSVVQSIAGQIFSSVKKMCGRFDRDDDDAAVNSGRGEESEGFTDETKLIEKVLKKLEKLSEITARRMPIDDFEQLTEENRALLQDFTVPHTVIEPFDPNAAIVEEVDFTEEQVDEAWKQLEKDELEREQLDRWDFHVGDITESQQLGLCTCLLLLVGGSQIHGSSSRRTSTGVESLVRTRSFVETVREGYSSAESVKYHNWLHACDVAFTMFRCLQMVRAEHFISVHERFAMIVSALCHDIGHPGYNNAFLIETSNELAVCYNDVSPLEHMHSARLFQIVSNMGTNVFANLPRLQYREVRQVCIDCILHTDNQRHYALLGELQVTYETEEDLFDAVAESYDKAPEEYPPSELIDFYCTMDSRKLIRAFFLHFVDLSNAMKPWRICKFWAELVFEEFFNQGDCEKAMGLPVQPLNDRDRVNKPQVQLGFTEYFVGPLSSVVARWMPPLRICDETLNDNLDKWMRRWLDTEPSSDDTDRFADRITRMRSGVGFPRLLSHVLSSGDS